MTITQTVEIPADRRVRFDFFVPREIPEGTARFEFKVVPSEKPMEKPVADGKILFSRKELDEMVQNSPTLPKLAGILHNDMTLDEIRMERLAKHL